MSSEREADQFTALRTVCDLDAYWLTLLRAALANGEKAAQAYVNWRQQKSLDAIGFGEFRVLPLLVQTALHHGVNDPEIARIKGASKHTWARNILRGRLLSEATRVLAAQRIPAVLLKGAALLARYPDLAKLRGSADFDLLVPRSEALHAVSVLRDAGFGAKGVCLDRFTDSDFDLVHALGLSVASVEGAIDIHWWPLPDFFDSEYCEAMFRRVETATFDDTVVTIPSLADHLFLSLARPTPDDQEEIFLRAVEVTLLLRGCDGRINWDLFSALVCSHGAGLQAATILDILRAELDLPVPQAVVNRLRTGKLTATTVRAVVHETTDVREIWTRESQKFIPFERPPVAYIRGFSIPEDGGRWTNGSLSVFAVLVEPTSILRGQVHFDARPYLPPGSDDVEVELYAGREPVQHVVLTTNERATATIVVPALTIGGEGTVALVALKVREPRSPKSLGLSDDPRHLGIMIQNARWICEM